MREPFYSWREVAVLFFCSGLLVGMIISFASCSPSAEPLGPQHITTITEGK